ncbi:protein kinase [Streptomyces sp. NBC_01255]|uniref:protein kinase domain-containing protein n=1 Tax=Streptomyces sp. NBC_01255 TaxID=2903798 RepID=UPI002E3812C0|nr:protein kinase [Streptomyces sp. NBC_01255]
MTVIAGRYRLLDVLAEGATATVWRALDETLVREVALKEFRAPAGLPADEVPLLYARLERTARAASRISHPSVVTVHGVATEDGRPWVVMELVRGLTLAETLEAAGPLSAPEAARVGAEVLAALRAAREAGVRHPGVDPGHVLLANDGRVVVTGFGTESTTRPEDEPDTVADLPSLGALLDVATGGRPGPLAAVVERLRSEDPESALTMDQTEEELRRIAPGATPRTTGPVRTESSTPRRGDGDGEGPRAGSPPSPPDRTPPPRRPSGPRRGPVLTAGLVGILLITGALTYHLVRDGEPGTGPGPGGVTSTAPAGPGSTGTGDGSATPPR